MYSPEILDGFPKLCMNKAGFQEAQQKATVERLENLREFSRCLVLREESSECMSYQIRESENILGFPLKT